MIDNTIDLFKYNNEISHTFPYLKDKMVIEFLSDKNILAMTNGLSVAQEVSDKCPTGFVARNLALISGKTQMAQTNINDHLIAGIEACRNYAQELSMHNALHAQSILEINRRVNYLATQVADITDYIVDFKTDINKTTEELRSDIESLKSYNRAQQELDNILARWQAGKFDNLSYMGQTYLILDTLKWGNFGLYINNLTDLTEKDRLLDTLSHQIVSNLKQKMRLEDSRSPIIKQKWLELPSTNDKTLAMQQALQYQGDWTWHNPENYGMAFTATQFNNLTQEEKFNYDGLTMSLLNIDRVSSRMLKNVFLTN